MSSNNYQGGNNDEISKQKLVSVLLAVAMVITWLLSFGGMSATAIAQNKISPELLSEFESLGATEMMEYVGLALW